MRFIEAKEFDRVAARAEELGGVGSGSWRIFKETGLSVLKADRATATLEESCPFCINGILDDLRGEPFAFSWQQRQWPGAVTNDDIVRNWRQENNLDNQTRMPWSEYVKAARLVRVVEGCER